MKQHLVEIKGSTLFEEYLQSMGLPSTLLDREQEIYLQERHLGAIRRVQGELRPTPSTNGDREPVTEPATKRY
ncbi:hypothetical protein PEKONANI_00383 [Aeromonas jandaei]|uniref:hypothetical protein n=1 Tax=Aeromonas jandaei TaxID=650 RepID=UPI00366A8022